MKSETAKILTSESGHEPANLILPERLVDERVRRDYGPFIRYAKSIAPAVDQREFSDDIVNWIKRLDPDGVAGFKKALFHGGLARGATLPRCSRGGLKLTETATKLARNMYELFMTKKRGVQ